MYLPPLPAPTTDRPPPQSERLALRGNVKIQHNITAIGIVPTGPFSRVTARLPNGVLLPLIWVRNHRPEWTSGYYFREPLRLAKGSRIQVEGSKVDVLVETQQNQRRMNPNART